MAIYNPRRGYVIMRIIARRKDVSVLRFVGCFNWLKEDYYTNTLDLALKPLRLKALPQQSLPRLGTLQLRQLRPNCHLSGNCDWSFARRNI